MKCKETHFHNLIWIKTDCFFIFSTVRSMTTMTPRSSKSPEISAIKWKSWSYLTWRHDFYFFFIISFGSRTFLGPFFVELFFLKADKNRKSPLDGKKQNNQLQHGVLCKDTGSSFCISSKDSGGSSQVCVCMQGCVRVCVCRHKPTLLSV